MLKGVAGSGPVPWWGWAPASEFSWWGQLVDRLWLSYDHQAFLTRGSPDRLSRRSLWDRSNWAGPTAHFWALRRPALRAVTRDNPGPI